MAEFSQFYGFLDMQNQTSSNVRIEGRRIDAIKLKAQPRHQGPVVQN